MTTGYLRVRNWDRWQYRADRNLPWIKVYRDLLLDPDFMALTDVQKGHLMCIWLAASARNGCIPDDANLVQRLISSEIRPELEVFLKLQFLEKQGKRRRPNGAPTRVEESRVEKSREEPPLPPALPGWLDADAWQRWSQHRTEIRKPLKPAQVLAQLNKLDGYRSDGHDPAAVIDHSIAGGWQGLFPPDKRRTNGPGYETAHDRIKRLNHTNGADPFAEHDERSAGVGHAAAVGSHERDLRG